ncbi:helix-turn-helix transcriptional regulator [Nocardia sp. NPDC005978]|uniref:helix-turn-helix transcriptional regulator n=1 Tax=Nocardia sp. NPDC005978 TaxID=3156725 RepID=UPI0033B11C1C
MSATSWQGAVLIRPGVFAFTGTIGPTDTHAHHAVQLMAARDAMTVVAADDSRGTGTQFVIPADTSHRIERGADNGVVVFLDPESGAGRAAQLRARSLGWTSGAPLIPDAADELGLDGLVSAVLETLAPDGEHTAATPRHPAVQHALDLLPELVAGGTVGTADIAARAGLSTSRLTHLFSAQVGLPLRRYALWLRLTLAIAEVAAGRDLTTAAHAAGFSDSAHLTRTCRENFGLAPSALSRNVHWHITHSL